MEVFRGIFVLLHISSSNGAPNSWGFRVFPPEPGKSSLLGISRSALKYLEIAPFDTGTK